MDGKVKNFSISKLLLVSLTSVKVQNNLGFSSNLMNIYSTFKTKKAPYRCLL